MKNLVVNHIFENSFGVIDIDYFDNILYVGSFEGCQNYITNRKREHSKLTAELIEAMAD